MLRRLLLAAILSLPCVPVVACPFCGNLRPTLAQQIDRADAAVLGDLLSSDGTSRTLRVRHVFKPKGRFSPNAAIEIGSPPRAEGAAREGSLLLALRMGNAAAGSKDSEWTTVELNEASYAYLARSPGPSAPPAKRLAYFLDFLEHVDPLIAEDAYLEFGRAPFDEIAKLADRLPVDHLRDLLADETVPPERKGLYGLLLGLAGVKQQRGDVAADFWQAITAPTNDFRSGFDGILGGYLWLGKTAALERLAERYLDDPQAAVGDVRHLMAALRVYHDYGRDIPADDLLRVYRRLLDRPAVAAAVAGDLRRWRDWQALDKVASLFGRAGYDDPSIERSVAGYLLACPLPAAQRQVARLRKLIPERVAEAERLEAEETGGK
ncbi:MAG TPA: hypothetical protein VHC22_18655 [Pirellulales bacterium]|nr:hypothetical protein [Pirellulales bacterium]